MFDSLPGAGSPQMELFPTSSSGVPHVKNTQVRTAKGAASTGTTSSCTSSDLLESVDPIGCALRIALTSELEALTGSPVNLSVRGTSAGRSFWVLTTSGRRTSASEPGLLPTARKTDADRGGRGDLIQVVRGNKTNSARGQQGMLPTPLKHDTKPGDPARDLRVSKGGGFSNLNDRLARLMLPTPRASDVDHGPDPTSHSPNLRTFLPTPTAQAFQTHNAERLLERREECKATHQNGNGFGLTLGNWLMLATPRANKWGEPDSHGKTIGYARLATPTAATAMRSGKASEATHARNSRPLGEQLDRQGLPGAAVLAAVSTWLMGISHDAMARALDAFWTENSAALQPQPATRSSKKSRI